DGDLAAECFEHHAPGDALQCDFVGADLQRHYYLMPDSPGHETRKVPSYVLRETAGTEYADLRSRRRHHAVCRNQDCGYVDCSDAYGDRYGWVLREGGYVMKESVKSILHSARQTVGVTVILMLVCGLLFPCLLTGLSALIFPHQADGNLLTVNGQT